MRISRILGLVLVRYVRCVRELNRGNGELVSSAVLISVIVRTAQCEEIYLVCRIVEMIYRHKPCFALEMRSSTHASWGSRSSSREVRQLLFKLRLLSSSATTDQDFDCSRSLVDARIFLASCTSSRALNYIEHPESTRNTRLYIRRPFRRRHPKTQDIRNNLDISSDTILCDGNSESIVSYDHAEHTLMLPHRELIGLLIRATSSPLILGDAISSRRIPPT